MQNHKQVQYTAHNARVWYPILHLRNDVLIGYTYIAQDDNKTFYACVQKCELRSYSNILHLLTIQIN